MYGCGFLAGTRDVQATRTCIGDVVSILVLQPLPEEDASTLELRLVAAQLLGTLVEGDLHRHGVHHEPAVSKAATCSQPVRASTPTSPAAWVLLAIILGPGQAPLIACIRHP